MKEFAPLIAFLAIMAMLLVTAVVIRWIEVTQGVCM
jgi:hypothetical protein